MKLVAVSQRVAIDPRHGERRDCLDQRWSNFIVACGLTPVPVPNLSIAAQRILDSSAISGVVLTGGNDLVPYGGDAPERDETENLLLDEADRRMLPVLAVCRGMQLVQHRFGVPLRRVEGHVTPHQSITIKGEREAVNSFHEFGTAENRSPLEVWATADDGIVKAVRHPNGRILGMMWHPERITPFSNRDIELFGRFFGVAS